MNSQVNGTAHHPSTATLLERLVQLLEEENVLEVPPETPIIDFKHPDKLKEILDISLQSKDPINETQQILDVCQKIIKFSVKTSHPFFKNQLYGGLDPYGLAGAVISEALNTSQYTFEVGPAFTLCENEVIREFLKLIGYENGDGIFSPGGSMSNMSAIVLARYNKFPECKREGIQGLPSLAIFTSADAHYSILKAANWLGIGTDNVISVETDSNGCMKPTRLIWHIEQALKNGKVPLIVNATSGTTVLGAFDPLDEIAGICKKYDIWFHVDACWGGSVIFSQKYKHYLNGVHLSDSVSWNAHKMLGAPLQCSMFLLKKKGLLHNCNSAKATYLFQQDKMYDVSYDTGDKSVQCGRKVDGFKLWLMWKVRGNHGIEQLVDNAMDMARYFKDQIAERPGFKLVTNSVQCTNVAFWYIPKRLRGREETNEWWNEIGMVAPALKEKFVLTGKLMIGYQPLSHKKLPNFFRMVITCHPPTTKKEIDSIIENIELHGQDL